VREKEIEFNVGNPVGNPVGDRASRGTRYRIGSYRGPVAKAHQKKKQGFQVLGGVREEKVIVANRLRNKRRQSAEHVATQEEAKRVVESHLPLVRALARSYLATNKPYVQLDDLIEAGRNGLLHALWRFKEERGVQFSTYAVYWARNEMLSWIRQERHTVHIPDHVYKAVLKTAKAAKSLGDTLGHAPSLEEIAIKRGLTILEAEEQLRWATPKKVPLDAPVGDGRSTVADSLVQLYKRDESSWRTSDPGTRTSQRSGIHKALATLTPVERKIIELRFGLDGMGARTLQEIATQLEIKPERVRTIETEALRELKHPSLWYLLGPWLREIVLG
jgi:RNA polymerase primary sigma factor